MSARQANRRSTATSPETRFRAAIDDAVRQITSSRKPWPLRKVRRAFERAYVLYLLESREGDRAAAAVALDIGFSTLKEKIRE